MNKFFGKGKLVLRNWVLKKKELDQQQMRKQSSAQGD